jgi:hypothetical protein
MRLKTSSISILAAICLLPICIGCASWEKPSYPPLAEGMGRLCVTLFHAPPWTTINIWSIDVETTVQEGHCVDLKPGLYEILMNDVLTGDLECEIIWPVRVEPGKVRDEYVDCISAAGPGPR